MSPIKSIAKFSISILIFSALTSSGVVADTPPTPGSACPGPNANFNMDGKVFKCVKSGGKYLWDNGSGTSTAVKLVVLGAPCNAMNATAMAKNSAAKCTKVKGKLQWVQMGMNNVGPNQGDSQNGQGNSGSSNNGSSPMKQNPDGTWQTLPGYPTDVAPPGNNGATWFQGNVDIYTASPTLPTCTSTTPITNSPAALSDIQSIQGQGYMQTGAHNLPVAHMYWNTGPTTEVDSNGLAYNSKKVKIYAPADMTLRTLSKSDMSRNGKSYSEYGLSFSLCGNYWVTWGHLDDLSPELLDAAKKAAKRECMTGGQSGQSQDCYDEYISYRVKAGTYIAMSSGRAHGFDLGFYDTSKLNENVLDPHAFKGRISTGKCVMNYAVEPLRSQLMAKLVGDRNCGSVGYDIPGTISGVWLNPNHMTESVIEDFHIALAAHWADSKLAVFAIGNKTSIPGLGAGVYSFTPNSSGPSNKTFASVKAGEVACYDHLTGWLEGANVSVGSILVKSETGSVEKIQIAGSATACGSGPYSLPGTTATFQRNNKTS